MLAKRLLQRRPLQRWGRQRTKRVKGACLQSCANQALFTVMTKEPVLMHSPLQKRHTSKGQIVEICIYKFVEDVEWVLEVVAVDGTSTVWNDKFATDKAALEEALRVIGADGIESFKLKVELDLNFQIRQLAKKSLKRVCIFYGGYNKKLGTVNENSGTVSEK